MKQNIREIVNGKMLPQFVGKQISIIGLVTSAHPNGLSFEIRSVDDVAVKVVLKKPRQSPIEGHVEVHGISQGQSVSCEEVIEFTVKEGSQFDVSGHDTVCKQLKSLPRLWYTE